MNPFRLFDSIFELPKPQEQPKVKPSPKNKQKKQIRNGQVADRRMQAWVTLEERELVKREANLVGESVETFILKASVDRIKMQEFMNKIQAKPSRSKKRISRSASDDLKLNQNVTLPLSKEMIYLIDAQAEQYEVNRSAFIRRAIDFYIGYLNNRKEVNA